MRGTGGLYSIVHTTFSSLCRLGFMRGSGGVL
jgi:hypothetical protein